MSDPRVRALPLAALKNILSYVQSIFPSCHLAASSGVSGMPSLCSPPAVSLHIQGPLVLSDMARREDRQLGFTTTALLSE